MIDAFRGSEVATFDVDSWVSNARAGGPLLVALEAGEGAGSCGTAWAAVLVGFDMAEGCYSRPKKRMWIRRTI